MGTIIPFVTMLLLVFGTAFEIEITPAYEIAAQIGDKLVLTCSTTGCETPRFSWRTQMDNPLGGTVNHTGSSSILTMDPVGFANEHDYLCSASCGDEKKEKNVKVDIYSFPRDPVIEISTPLNVGEEASVTCKVDRVYPSDRLELQLEKNGSVLARKEFYEDTSTKTTETKSLTWTFSPTFEDIGKEISCVAELPINEMEFEPKKRQTSQRLCVNFGPQNTKILVSPSNIITEGGMLMLTCRSESNPPARIVWRRELENSSIQRIIDNDTLIIPHARMSDSGLFICEAMNDAMNKTQRTAVTISVQAFEIEITPAYEIAAQIGDKLVLTCSTTGCETPRFSWRTQMDNPLGGTVNHTGSSSILTMDPVGFANEHDYLCSASCGDEKKEKNVKVDIYSFPRDPVIEISTPLNVGEEASVTCKVDRVYPSDRLELQLEKNGSVLARKEFYEDTSTKTTETKSLTWTFSPTFEDIGKEISCVAELPINEMEFEPKKRQTSQRLCVNFGPQNTKILVSPSNIITEGGMLMLTCRSESNPPARIVWRRELENSSIQRIIDNDTLIIPHARISDSGLFICEAMNDAMNKTQRTAVTISVQAFEIEITPAYEIAAQIGDKLVLTCSTTGCETPRFSWRTQMDNPLGGTVNHMGSSSILTMDPVGFANEHDYLCSASCGDEKKEKNVKVDIYSFPRDPVIEISTPLNVGEEASVTCKVDRVYPSDRLELQLEKNGTVLARKEFYEDTSTKTTETKSLTWTFSPTFEDIGKEISCVAELPINEMEFEPKKRQTSQRLSINYGPRNTTVSVSPSATVREGEAVRMTCTSHGNPPPKISWTRCLFSGESQLLSDNAALTISSMKAEDFGIYECQSVNQLGREKKAVDLIVRDTVKEGDSVTFSCTSEGIPAVQILLRKKTGSADPVLVSENGRYTIYGAQIEDGGIYECESSNKLRQQYQTITLDVKESIKRAHYMTLVIVVVASLSTIAIPALVLLVYMSKKARINNSYRLVNALKPNV